MIHKRRIEFIFLISFLLIIKTNFLTGQFGASLNLTSGYDDNTYQNYENLPDIIHQPYFSLFYNLSGSKSRMRFYYEGLVTFFQKYTTRQYQFHVLGFSGNRYNDEGNHLIAYGLEAGKRLSRPDYEYYDYLHGLLFLNVQFNNNHHIIYFGVRSKVRSYEHLPQYSFWEVNGNIKNSFFLRTKTTLIANIQVGYKRFLETQIDQEVIEESFGSSGNGNGWGHGKGKGNSAGDDSTESHVVQVVSPATGILQVTASLRLAQSLGSKTGTAVEGMIKRNPGGGGRILIGQDSGYEENDELFDDPYSYENDKIIFEITRYLPWRIKAKAELEYSDKRYFQPAFDLEGNEKGTLSRRDFRKLLRVSFQKNIPVTGILKSVVLLFDFTYLVNDSNDDYYNFENKAMNGGIGFRF